MYCCDKKLEVSEWDGVGGMGPNLIIITCPICFQKWAFTPWMPSWSKLDENNSD